MMGAGKSCVGGALQRQSELQLFDIDEMIETEFGASIRYLVTKNLSFTLSGDMQHTEVLGPDNSFVYIPSSAVCGTTVACDLNTWGGGYVVFAFSGLPGRSAWPRRPPTTSGNTGGSSRA